jgi:hypothetical protein
MGKRELLLIASFVVIGIAVYYVTAPAAAPGDQGISVSRIIEHIRREVQGNRSSAEVSTSKVVPVTPELAELRFDLGSAPLTVTGEDRTDIVFDLIVWSNGYDETEARKYATETVLKTSEAGTSLSVEIEYPEPAQQRATLVARVPRRLAVRVLPSRGKILISDVAAAEIVEARGQVTVARIDGRVAATHRGGKLEVQSVGSLKLNARGSVTTLKDIKGDVTLQLQAGELNGAGLGGPIEVDSNGTRITLEDLSATRKPIRINAANGTVVLAGVRADTRIEGRDTRVEVSLDRPAPIAIYAEGDEPLNVTLPQGGFDLDALVTNANLTVPDGLPEVKSTGNERRINGPVYGGGPTITLRATRGNIVLRNRSTT